MFDCPKLQNGFEVLHHSWLFYHHIQEGILDQTPNIQFSSSTTPFFGCHRLHYVLQKQMEQQ